MTRQAYLGIRYLVVRIGFDRHLYSIIAVMISAGIQSDCCVKYHIHMIDIYNLQVRMIVRFLSLYMNILPHLSLHPSSE